MAVFGRHLFVAGAIGRALPGGLGRDAGGRSAGGRRGRRALGVCVHADVDRHRVVVLDAGLADRRVGGVAAEDCLVDGLVDVLAEGNDARGSEAVLVGDLLDHVVLEHLPFASGEELALDDCAALDVLDL